MGSCSSARVQRHQPGPKRRKQRKVVRNYCCCEVPRETHLGQDVKIYPLAGYTRQASIVCQMVYGRRERLHSFGMDDAAMK